MKARELAESIHRAANAGEGLSLSQMLRIEDEIKEVAKEWYLKAFTAHPKFRAVAERQFEERWKMENP
jgi:hypothetical protein